MKKPFEVERDAPELDENVLYEVIDKMYTEEEIETAVKVGEFYRNARVLNILKPGTMEFQFLVELLKRSELFEEPEVERGACGGDSWHNVDEPYIDKGSFQVQKCADCGRWRWRCINIEDDQAYTFLALRSFRQNSWFYSR